MGKEGFQPNVDAGNKLVLITGIEEKYANWKSLKWSLVGFGRNVELIIFPSVNHQKNNRHLSVDIIRMKAYLTFTGTLHWLITLHYIISI